MPFARYKGKAEKALLAAGFPSVYIFRLAYICPVEPRKEPNFGYRILRGISLESSGDSTPTKSTASFSISGITSDRLTIPTMMRSRDFPIAIRHRATWEFAAFNTIQSFGFSFTNSSKRRTAVVGLIFNIEAVWHRPKEERRKDLGLERRSYFV
jgi:hypothetical protein